MPSLSNREFHDQIDTLQAQLEDILDDSDLDLDIENKAGVLTLTFSDNSQLIFSRQEALQQLWLATRNGGFHFDYHRDEQRWFCRATGQSLGSLLTHVFAEQAQARIAFPEL